MILSFIIFSLICILGLIASAIPAYLVYLREKRLRKLAAAKFQISSSVSEMQEVLLEGQITCGHVCHDELFELMQFVQASEQYPLKFNLWKKPSPESKAFALRVENDLVDKKSIYSQVLLKFISAYYAAFKYKHPIILLRTNFYLLFSKAFVHLVLNALKLTLKGLSIIEALEKEWRKLKDKRIREVLIAETYGQVNPSQQMTFSVAS